MNIILFKISIVLTITVFLFPKQIQYYLALILHISIAVITSIWAVNTLFFTSKMVIPFIPFLGKILPIEIDQLTAFFILIINFTTFTGIIYAKGYLQP
jgi:NADH:ubiquinone oxidoreductase subunit 5 (subunit L)/multisubunit Na+/H+ antiporter MnhA subunit